MHWSFLCGSGQSPTRRAAGAACASSWSTVRTAVKASQDNTRGTRSGSLGPLPPSPRSRTFDIPAHGTSRLRPCLTKVCRAGTARPARRMHALPRPAATLVPASSKGKEHRRENGVASQQLRLRLESRRLNVFERGVEPGVEFCFILVRCCLGRASEIGGNIMENSLHLIIR